MRKLATFDCFCGLGGLSLGAESAGLEVVGGIDADSKAITVYRRLFPKALGLCEDLLSITPRTVLRRAGIQRGDIDVLLGGPPCQPYSINNHQRGTHDVRCSLVERYLEFVSALHPKWLVMENVPGFVSIEGGSFFRSLMRSLRARGYKAEAAIVNAAKFGVPQRRRRLVVMASRDATRLESTMRELASQHEATVTVGDALGDLPDDEADLAPYRSEPASKFQRVMREMSLATVQGHIASRLGPRNLARIKHVPPGGNWRDIPRRLLPAGMKRARLSDHTTRYGRLRHDEPAFTLLTKCDPHWGCFLHPRRDRVLTVREAARLQSIPDRVQFPEDINTGYRLIGNAVPPLLAKRILELI